jgi:hypothetical protein
MAQALPPTQEAQALPSTQEARAQSLLPPQGPVTQSLSPPKGPMAQALPSAQEAQALPSTQEANARSRSISSAETLHATAGTPARRPAPPPPLQQSLARQARADCCGVQTPSMPRHLGKRNPLEQFTHRTLENVPAKKSFPLAPPTDPPGGKYVELIASPVGFLADHPSLRSSRHSVANVFSTYCGGWLIV